MTLAARLNLFRGRCGLSLDAAAEKAGISKTYLWELEADTDGQKKPSADVLSRLAAAYSTTLSELMGTPIETVSHLKEKALKELDAALAAIRDIHCDDDHLNDQSREYLEAKKRFLDAEATIWKFKNVIATVKRFES